LREKPESEEQAREYLTSYGDRPAQTNTAVVVTNTQTKKQAEGLDIARVFFREIPSDVIDQLIAGGLVMKTSGGFIIEHPLINPYIERIEGEESSITGLPLTLTNRLMREVE
jgi:septum formation protein